MGDDKTIREIEQIIDIYHKQSNFVKSYSDNQAQALYDILRVFEGLFSAVLTGGVGQDFLGLKNAQQVAFSDVHNLQDALNTAIGWICKDCALSKTEVSHHLSKKEASMAADLLVNYADPYSVVVDGYISYSRKHNVGRIDGNKVIFDATKEQLTSFLCDAGERFHDDYLAFSEMIMGMCLSPEFQSELDVFAGTIRHEDGRMCYEISETLWNYAHNIGSKQWEATSTVPQTWEFEHFSLLEYKNCWIALYSVCLLHFFAKLKSGMDWLAQENAVIVLPKGTVIKCVQETSGIEKGTVEAIINFLTYDQHLLNTDIMYQPIVAIGDLLIITPSLILASNPERNMIAVIQKKKDSKYSVEVNDLEDIMANELISCLPNDTVYCTSRHLTKELPDVDLAIYDSLSNSLLIAEMKWLIAADSTKEVIERQKDIDHGCSQVQAIMDYAMKDSVAFANRILPVNITEKPDLFWCVVAKHDIRSTNGLVPVINQNGFADLLNHYSLNTVFHKIRNREYYKSLPDNSYVSHKKVNYAGYEFWIPALVIEKEYEVWE